MYESYIKEVPIIDFNKEESEAEILRNIMEAQKRLELAHQNFEYARRRASWLLYLSNKIRTVEDRLLIKTS